MREIAIDSIAAWAARHREESEKYSEAPQDMPESLVEEYTSVSDGRAVLVTPDGRRWMTLVGGRCDEPMFHVDLSRDDQDYLLDTIVDHGVRAECMQSDLPMVLVEMGTERLGQSFCYDCDGWVDLAADVEFYDRLGNRRG